jgi:transposase
MQSTVRYVGLDVHKDTIVMAVAEAGTQPAEIFATLANDPAAVLSRLRKLGPLPAMVVCYEAGPTGYELYRFLNAAGVQCHVVAPSMVPTQNGNRVKTDRRDARRLAHFLRSGDLTAIWVPDEHTEALRDLTRSRDDAKQAERTARHQLSKFLLRKGRRFDGKSHWTLAHWAWIKQQTFAHEAANRVLTDYIRTAERATQRVQGLMLDISQLVESWALAPLVKNLQAFRGVQLVTAAGLAAEVGDFHRFATAGQFMGFVGLVPSEHTSGPKRRQGGITKSGNRHLRRLLIEAGWHYYRTPLRVSAELHARRVGIPQAVIDIADKALKRLGTKSYWMKQGTKPPNKIVTALARELAGFVWAAARLSTTPPGIRFQNASRQVKSSERSPRRSTSKN